MLDSQLEYRLKRLGMSPKLARHQTAKIRDLYFPAAIVARETFNDPGSPLGCACLGTLGINMLSAGKTGSYVSTGASVGSAVPGVGTAIGAAVGLAVAALAHVFGNKDVRASGAQKGECVQFLNQYVAAANQAGAEVTIGPQLGIDNLEKINWCLAATYGGPVGNVDPRFFSIGWLQALEYAKQLVRAAFTQPIGSSFTSSAITGNTADGKHPNTRPAMSTQLPNPLTIAGLADRAATFMIASCSGGNKYAGNCPGFWHNPTSLRMLFDLIGYQINTQFPQVFAPPVVVATPAVVAQAGTVVAQTGTTTVVNPATGQPVVVPIAAVTPAAPTPGASITLVPDPGYATGPVMPWGGYMPVGNPTVDAVGGQMASGGVNMNSPEAKGILADVAAEGVVKTPAGPPSPMQAGLGIGAAVLMGLLLLGGMKHGR